MQRYMSAILALSISAALVSGCYATSTDATDAGPQAPTTDSGSTLLGDDTDFVVDSGLPPDAAHGVLQDAYPPGDHAGDVWDGYIESFMFPSGSDHVHIVFDSATGDGPRTGTVIFGMGTPPAPPTDPSVGYPSGYDFRTGSADRPAEGFVYPITAGSVAGARVRVTVSSFGFWETWCELQVPVPLGSGSTGYGCLPEGGGAESSMGCIYEPGSAPAFSIDCGRMHLCQPPGSCDCSSAGCGATARSPINFDFNVNGTRGDGSIAISDGLFNVHLTH